MTEEMKIKREELKALSKGLQVLVKHGVISCVNEGLQKNYATLGHTILKTFNQWKEEGYKVKKGSKALLLWGAPIGKPNKEANQTEQNETESEAQFYPLAYVFSNLQVGPSNYLAK